MESLTDLVASQNAPDSNYRQMAIEKLMSSGQPITGDLLQKTIMQLVGSQPTQVPINQAVAASAGEVVPSPSTAANGQPPPAPMQKPSGPAATSASAPQSVAASPEDAMLDALIAQSSAQDNPAVRSEAPVTDVPATNGFGAKEGTALALLTAILAASSPQGRRMAAQIGDKMLGNTSVGTTAADTFGPAATLRNPAPTSQPSMRIGPRQSIEGDIMGTPSGNVPDTAAEARLSREFNEGKPAVEGPKLRAIKLQEAMERQRMQRRGASQRQQVRPGPYQG